MDTSEQYIKQCEKAEEIQKIKSVKHYPSTLTCTLWRTSNGQTIDVDGDFLSRVNDYGNIAGYRYVWLPTQDQLQEMLGVKNHTPYVGALYKWLKDNNYDQYFDNVTSNPYSSMEQIQLAFVMKTLYSKVWDGDNWVKEKNESKSSKED